MKLKSIFAVCRDKELEKQYEDIRDGLLKRFECNSLYEASKKAFEEHTVQNKYYRNVHEGKLREGVKLTELEVSMLCDGGFSHFGGSSVSRDGRFHVEIYTD